MTLFITFASFASFASGRALQRSPAMLVVCSKEGPHTVDEDANRTERSPTLGPLNALFDFIIAFYERRS